MGRWGGFVIPLFFGRPPLLHDVYEYFLVTPTAAHGIKTVRFHRKMLTVGLRRQEKRPFGPYSTDRLIDLARRLFMKLHSINEFLMFKISISPVKNR